MKKLVIPALAALFAVSGTTSVLAEKYALCVGLSKYDMAAYDAMGWEITPLEGCVNDAAYMKKNLTERGGWDEADVTVLTNASATKGAIRAAIADAAAKAEAGDTFVYQHSSHGIQGEDYEDFNAALAAYENLYKDTELAEDLEAFADGVKVVILIDACHSGGMFDDGDDDGDAEPAGKARSAASFDIARRVSALMGANRAARKVRGEDVSRNLTADQVGWVTAAAYEETAKDAGYYDTDEWLVDLEADDGEESGGALLASCAWGWWSGKADVSGEGDGDGWFDAYEGWSFATHVCAEYDQTPQFLNEDVLRSVELGWVGEAAPSEAIVFDPVPGAEVAIGEEATLDVVARNADGSTEGITLSIVDTNPEDLEYDFADGTLAFTPEEDGIFLFTVQAENGQTSATKILGVTAVLPAPVALEVEEADIGEGGFTARWLGIDAARKYQIQVSTSDSFPLVEPDMVIDEDFKGVTTNLATLTAKGWTFEGGKFGTYTGKAYCGEAAPAIKIASKGINTLTSPAFKLKRVMNGLSFWVKCVSTNPTSTVTVELLVGGEWTELDSFVPSPDGETKEYEKFDPSATQVRFVVDKAAGNVSIDDVKLLQAGGDVVIDEDGIPAGATSYEATDLQSGTTYHFRVRAIGGTTKGPWSEVIAVTTAGEAPIPVPELTALIPEVAPDTTFFAFWTCPGVSEFRLQVATDEEFASLVYDEELSESIKTVTGLTPETTYYVRVCGLLGERAGDWSNVESVTTAAGEGPAGPAKYALCVGLSEYDMAAYDAMGLKITPLDGCTNDAIYMKKNLTERGGWTDANVTLLTNASATKGAIRAAIAAAAAKAEAGDTFVYEHSSHGLQGDDDDDFTAALAAYENLYKDSELAEDLAAFADGVKVVILIDACHSAGMFGDGDDAGDAEPAGKARSAASFDIARRVSALMGANRAARKVRGEDVSRNLTADQVGWVTAAAYEETAKDAGYYDTDEWLVDLEADDGEESGGALLASCAWGWWSGKADVSGEGDGDGWFDAYEGWSFSTPVCAEYNQTPQYLNEDVLRSVELGWVGEAAPSEAIVFDPVPGVEVAIGEEAKLSVVAKNAYGTTEGITLSIVATDPEKLEYDFAGGTLAFTPEEDGLFLFTVQAANGGTSATKILGVSAPLPAPVALEATDIDDGGFTANWTGVEAAQYYHLQVSTDGSFPEMLPDMLIEEGFDDVTNKASLLAKDWNFTGTFGTYASGGEAPPSIKLSSDKSVLTTPSFKLSGAKNGLSFWTKGFVSGTNEMTSVLTVQQCVGDPENEEDWETIEDGTFVPSTDGEPKEFENLDKDATRIRFVMAKASGNIAIDDDVVVHSTGGIVVDEEEIDGEETSFAVADLQPGTTYYYRVRAKGNTKSAWSETIEVTTTGEAPIPVPDLTAVIPETDPDTSLFAFWLCTGVTEFRLQVATDAEFGALVYDEELSESIKTVTGLTPETTYYVRVCGLVGERVGDWSNVESVTTAPGGPVPPPSEAGITGMTIADGQMTITFEGEGAQVLLSTDLVDWTPVEGATSPYTLEMDDGAQYIGVR